MTKQYHALMTLLTIFCISSTISAEKAVVVVPVADLVSTPFGTCARNSYDTIPLCGAERTFYRSFPRIHQLIFNEIVDIVDRCADEVRVVISSVYYCSSDSATRQCSYWTHKKNVMPLATIARQTGDVSLFPPALSFDDQKNEHPGVITLFAPFYDPVTKKSYSAGTRFSQKSDTLSSTTYMAHLFNPDTMRWIVREIPKAISISNYGTTPSQKRALFMRVLRSWATENDGFIPYVWGGSSFTHRYAPESFKQSGHTTKPFIYYTQTNATNPKTGFDCANLIARAAQIAGIPYFFKNSATVAQSIEPLTAHDSVQVGDIIWIPGHVMVVADLKKNRLIEASSYMYGRGKVQEVPISAVFDEVATYQQLFDLHLHNKMVRRINTLTHKKEDAMIPVKLLNMSSVWKK